MRSHWRTHRLYDGTAHPRRVVLEHLAEQVLARLGLDASGKKMEHGPELLRMLSAPLYPSTYRGLIWVSRRTRPLPDEQGRDDPRPARA